MLRKKPIDVERAVILRIADALRVTATKWVADGYELDEARLLNALASELESGKDS